MQKVLFPVCDGGLPVGKPTKHCYSSLLQKSFVLNFWFGSATGIAVIHAMNFATLLSKATVGRAYFVCGLLVGVPGMARAQAGDSILARPNIISLSPAELFYKTQIGYERQLSKRSTLGAQALYRYGFDQRYKGWQATLLYRCFVSKKGFPTGLYFQAQASLFNFQQEASLIDNGTHKPYYFEYRALSGGVGGGMGFRQYVLRRAFGQHLLGNALLGIRAQVRPEPTYDSALYHAESSFLGPVNDANWHLSALSPGSILHGLLTLDYQF